MAKKPTDLTKKGWNGLKQTLAPKTGFGEKLDAYATAKAKLSDLQKRNMKAYTDAASALKDITDAIPGAQKKCEKFKDTVAVLDGYKALATKEGFELVKEQQLYTGYIDQWIRVRQVSLKELGVIHTAMEKIEQDATKDIKQALSTGNKAEAIKATDAALVDLKKRQKDSDESCETWRVPRVGKEQPHVDDRPDTLFGPLTKLVNEIIATRQNAERALQQVKAKLEVKV